MALSSAPRRSSWTRWWWVELTSASTQSARMRAALSTVLSPTADRLCSVPARNANSTKRTSVLKFPVLSLLIALLSNSIRRLSTLAKDPTAPQQFSALGILWRVAPYGWLSPQVKCSSTMAVRVAVASSCAETKSRRASSVSSPFKKLFPKSWKCCWRPKTKCGRRKWKSNSQFSASPQSGPTSSSTAPPATEWPLRRRRPLRTKTKKWTDLCLIISIFLVSLFRAQFVPLLPN